jgi:hypothetical protein
VHAPLAVNPHSCGESNLRQARHQDDPAGGSGGRVMCRGFKDPRIQGLEDSRIKDSRVQGLLFRDYIAGGNWHGSLDVESRPGDEWHRAGTRRMFCRAVGAVSL